VSGTALAFMRTERERSAIRGAFGLYLSPDQVERIARHPELLQLGGEMREITVMFTDVRGFTRISEQFDPHGLTRFMNRFLTPMTDLIRNHRGTIDKYMGDAIMAFWNAPLDVDRHAALACDTALAMQARLVELNEEWKAEAEAEGRGHIPVNIGIGLNTGQASVGNFGSMQRFTYSCLGDDVNLASRLEGQCKTYSVGIIIGDKTRLQVPDYAALEIDLVMVKGKTEPERVHALVGGLSRAGAAAGGLPGAIQDRRLRRGAGLDRRLRGCRGCARLAAGLLRHDARAGRRPDRRFAARLDGSVCRPGEVSPSGASPPSKRWSAAMSGARPGN
jgi:adenylate cyclase